MTETVTGAIAKRDNSPSGLVAQYRGDFAAVLPSHVKPDQWVRLAQGVLRRDKQLAQAAESDPASLMTALLDAARQGLEPGTEQYYLTPRKIKGRPTVVGMPGYQGVVELIYRAGAVSSVIVETVYTGDAFAYRPGRDERPVHDVDWDAPDRGELRLAYAYAVMKDGATSKVVVVNRADIERAKKTSQGSDSPYSPWQQHPEAMWLKTAAKRLAKWVPTSAEYMREQLRAAQDVAAEQPAPAGPPPPADQPDGVDTDTGEVVDAEVVGDV